MSICVMMNGPGAPDVLHAADINIAAPDPGEVRLRQSVIGVNFVDIYYRTGLYPLPRYPAVLGFEGAGVVDAVGPDVTSVFAR